ncbi:hypothetical protein FA10DRAFT_286099 [Acaromyces ingoldii]|uniref:Mitochondrial DNA polymerase catalytic subunit n=1 Tax=Acaromyces ingoldii TaxID=215250 RepID=A0A316YP02_9BASI|nr:hypothetical protein FA10DRAFT_286099 [Acaromyces ingoldii]PWN90388.1 hypothetical protein FA10DRAFT_286099 [Acaromyces ingoldii]
MPLEDRPPTVSRTVPYRRPEYLSRRKKEMECPTSAQAVAPVLPGMPYRNAVGVQLLSRPLHAQLFPPGTSDQVPPIHPNALSLCQHHLSSHGLKPEQASTLPETSFDLPPLQGKDLGEHFWNIGREAAQPWLGMAHEFASQDVPSTMPDGVSGDATSTEDEDGLLCAKDWLSLDVGMRKEMTPRPPKWQRKSGWTRYPVLRSSDGHGCAALGEGEAVEYPLVEDGALVFDVETMVTESQFAVMATAASPNAWYAWLSPWLLGETTDKAQLIPFGPSGDQNMPARLVIGHNVSYDRGRVRDEYSLKRGNTRWLDTMSLHVATRGISSPQRGAWIKHSKTRALEKMLDEDGIEERKKAVIASILGGQDVDEDTIAALDLEDLIGVDRNEDQGNDLASIDAILDSSNGSARSDATSRAAASTLWQDITSKNSLADVAKLHCDITVSKDVRNVFIDGTSREEILSMLDELLHYCATDVAVTHKVFQKVWPAFVANCPHPATVAGVLGLGSAILPVDDEWIDYQRRSNETFEAAHGEVRKNLVKLAEELRSRGTEGVSWDQAMAWSTAKAKALEEDQDEEQETSKMWWDEDAWTSQLDWTPKKPKKIRLASTENEDDSLKVPMWYRDKVLKSPAGLGTTMAATPAVLRLHLDGKPIIKGDDGKWKAKGQTPDQDEVVGGSPLRQAFLKKGRGLAVKSHLDGNAGEEALSAIRGGSLDKAEVRLLLSKAAEDLIAWAKANGKAVEEDAQLTTLDWQKVEADTGPASTGDSDPTAEREWWPKWYWDLIKPGTGEVELTIRSKVAPTLLKVSWEGCPLYHSREHGWVFLHDIKAMPDFTTRQKPLKFKHEADESFKSLSKEQGLLFYKVPHVAGDNSNVGSPFSKGFVPFFEKETLKSELSSEAAKSAAKAALEMNSQCSYWIGVRDRVEKQMVVWDGQGGSSMLYPQGASGARPEDAHRKKGMILPQVVPMGTVTRRAIEKTWLTASNAKANRVGSELKAMVKAPPGWSIVGADVDSEELWICSVMGDAQFGIHGATAVGWMTLEGTKALGTDLHSKTANILGTGRNQAKVFNYSRIYGAGIRHSSQLLLKASPSMSNEEATRKAKELYATTKGTNTYTDDFFGRRFWYGGTESYVFNKLEEVALSAHPTTPALDCGVTAALSRKYLPKVAKFGRMSEDYMPSRVNWVVQSSGVDYLHLLIASMEHLCRSYDIDARFMISVHDEVRYLARDEDAHRAALALQVANLWTRAMFAFKLQMDDLPQGCAFFAQVDVDKVLRKEADDPCVTPSQPVPIPPGQAYEIEQTLKLTNGGSLFADGRAMKSAPLDSPAAVPVAGASIDINQPGYVPSKQLHRSTGERGLRFLQAQTATEVGEIAALEQRAKMAEERVEREKATAAKRQTKTPPTQAAPAASAMAPKKPLRAAARSLHTSSAARPTEDHDAIRSLVKAFPVRRFKTRKPFFKLDSHRSEVLMLYRRLMKACPKLGLPKTRATIRGVARAKKKLTSPRQTDEVLQRARGMIDRFERAKRGDEEATREMREMEEELVEKDRVRRWELVYDRYLRSVKEEARGEPRRSGALLAPSFYTVGMHRYKPFQPESVTMIIKRRRLARWARYGRSLDLDERARMIKEEVQIWNALRSQQQEKAPRARKARGEEEENLLRGWNEPFADEMREMRAAYDREEARSKSQMSIQVLREAKEARRAKHRARLRNKMRREREKEKAELDAKPES